MVITVGAAIAALFVSRLPNNLYHRGQSGHEKKHIEGPSTIEASGKILGVAIGCTLEEAHEKLDALRDPTSGELREKEANEGEGEKAYWRLVGTDYSWIMAWANKEGRLVQLSASVRPEKPKPFEEIGDLANASTNLDSAAKWHVSRPDNLSYHLVARGPNRRANNIYMIATGLER
jgi:hypothetical protein